MIISRPKEVVCLYKKCLIKYKISILNSNYSVITGNPWMWKFSRIIECRTSLESGFPFYLFW